jgi:predicted metal-dependent HD superfamily phosphohydrolase
VHNAAVLVVRQVTAGMREPFTTSWARAWSGLSGRGEGLVVRDALLGRYAEPHRRYHTLQHLEECLRLFAEVQHIAAHPAEIEIALWFHDAIYDVRSSRNEALSAAWARDALRDGGVGPQAAERVHDLVLATRHAAAASTGDEQVLVDIDLAILGASPERFAEYEQQIRAEYSHVPDVLFRHKRREILQSFLGRERIYGTEFVRERYEQQARLNLAQAIAI